MLDKRQIVAVTLLTVVTLPLAAQAPRGPAARRPAGTPSATELLNARRALRLTPRQVARLDSMERTQFAARETLRRSMRAQRDSLCGGAGPCRLSPEQREQARARFQAALPQRQAAWRRDSLGRASAWALLDSTQRGQIQGMRMMAAQRRFAQARGDRFAQPGRRGPAGGGPRSGFVGPQGRRWGDQFGPRGQGNTGNWRGNAGPRWRQGPPGPVGGQGPGAGLRGRRGRPGGDVTQPTDTTQTR